MWFGSLPRSSRTTVIVFLAVAVVSSGLLAAFGWLLLKQDQDLADKRRQERLDQAAARFAADLEPALAVSWPSDAATPPVPSDAMLVVLSPEHLFVTRGELVYHPYEPLVPASAPAQTFEHGEQLEHAVSDYTGASVMYAGLTRSADTAVRAGALGRLARVKRKLGATDEALRAYDELLTVPDASVDGFPATLFARLGRASALAEAGRSETLRAEARAIGTELTSGRWPLSKAQYDSRLDEVEEWLGERPHGDAARLALAQAVEWLWQRRATLPASSHRVLDDELTSGPAVVAWNRNGDVIQAGVAGPGYLSGLDASFREEAARRRMLAASAFAAVGLVLAAGWFFILRSIAREGRLLELQSDFVSAVSHEFRSPLTSMAHVADMLQSDRVPSPDVRRASYDVLVRDTTRLRRLVEDLLDFRRFEVGSAAFRPERLDLVEFVRAIVADFEAGTAAAGFQVELSTPEAPVHLRGDRDALARALWNLLDNAVKYSPECRTIWVELSRDGHRATISVRDRGMGIPIDEQRRVFERFVRGAAAKARRIKGTGIGLALVRHIVHAHAGEVTLVSEPGQGSRFTIVLPAPAGAES